MVSLHCNSILQWALCGSLGSSTYSLSKEQDVKAIPTILQNFLSLL